MIISAYQLEILRIFLEAQTGSRSRNPEEITSKCLLFPNSCYNSFPFCQFSIATKNDCMKNARLMNDRSLEKIKKKKHNVTFHSRDKLPESMGCMQYFNEDLFTIFSNK